MLKKTRDLSGKRGRRHRVMKVEQKRRGELDGGTHCSMQGHDRCGGSPSEEAPAATSRKLLDKRRRESVTSNRSTRNGYSLIEKRGTDRKRHEQLYEEKKKKKKQTRAKQTKKK